MGLFDKLIKKVGDTIESAIIGPMNEGEQRYYDIILNLLLSVRRLQKVHIQKFIEVKYSERCDEVTLDKVLEKFDTCSAPKTNETWYHLTSVQSSRADYKNGSASWFKKEEIRDICFADFAEEIRLKFKEIYEVVKANPTKSILNQGISKIIENYKSDFPDYGEYSYYQMAIKVIGQEIVELFHRGDSFVQDLVRDEAISWLKYDYDHNSYDYIPHLYAHALRAFHFEKVDKAAKEYVSITLDDCREAASRSDYYQKEMKERPFDKDFILDTAAKNILKCDIIIVGSESNWMYWVVQDIKLVDKACYMAWKKIADEYEDTDETVEDAVLTLNDYVVDNAD